MVEKEHLIKELGEKWKSLELQNEKLNSDLKTSKEDLEQLTKAKQSLEVQLN